MALIQFKFILPIFLVAFLVVPSIQAKDVRYCDKKGNYAVKVSGVDIDPEPVISGMPATFNIYASSEQAILGGQLAIEVSYFGVHIHTEKHDLCEETTCPISSGDFVISHTQVLPGFTPPGPYSLKMKLAGGDGKQLTCIGFDFKIQFGSSVADS
ncbi:MD-2-related lipid-recognition domain [Macleaya cordata]|uniref:MD-2-related lipid-recognition domain n=1 Tax=Macleaya cordata TaxID=56857 RepID=A0A200R327_MACCD|nr:MD-2-related lipid-recognition domain [Macleaya cordata]